MFNQRTRAWSRWRARRTGLIAVVAAVLAAVGFAVLPPASMAATVESKPASYPNPGRVTGDVSPVHDPSVVKAQGRYLVAHTGRDIPLKTSTDRTDFKRAGTVFPNGPKKVKVKDPRDPNKEIEEPWTYKYTDPENKDLKTKRDLWAPDLSYHGDTYYLYYSASTFASNKSAIGLATSTTGNKGDWTDHGLVIESNDKNDFNAIDPNLIVDGKRWYLSFGSFWSGIKMIELNPDTGLPKEELDPKTKLPKDMKSIAGRSTDVGGAIEAPTIFKHDDCYYLYVSFDRCCQAAKSTYRVMVGRSKSVTGPFVDRVGRAMTEGGGTEVLSGHGSIHGPGHQSPLADSDGDILFYHYYPDSGTGEEGKDCGYCTLGINRIGYDADGWPYVY